jgi:acyl-coenzyme A thioesterase PaaI-like protein
MIPKRGLAGPLFFVHFELMNLSDLKNLGDEFLKKSLPPTLRHTARIRLLGLLKIPVLFFVGPRVLEIDDNKCSVLIPLNLRTRNHLNSLYFGALAVGADVAVGILTLKLGDEYGKGRIGIVFKDFKAEFLKRAEGDTLFVCEEGEKIRKAVEAAVETRERQNLPVRVTATVPSDSATDPVAEFTLTLSLKYK